MSAASSVDVSRLEDRLAVVERVEQRELFLVLLDQIADAPHDLAALGGRHLGPRAVLERVARRGDRTIDVVLVALVDIGELLLGRRVDRRERLAGGRRHPFTADQQLLRAAFEELRS
jgi:hypothetical protein